MKEIKWRTTELGLIQHNGRTEVVESVDFFDSEEEAKEKIDAIDGDN